MESGVRPSPSTPPFPICFLSSRPLPPAFRLWWFIAVPIFSTIPIHLSRCTTITLTAATTDLLLPSRPTATATATSTTGRATTTVPEAGRCPWLTRVISFRAHRDRRLLLLGDWSKIRRIFLAMAIAKKNRWRRKKTQNVLLFRFGRLFEWGLPRAPAPFTAPISHQKLL